VATDVWLFDLPPRGADGFGRPLGWPGATLIAQAASSRACPAGDGPCQPVKLADRRSRCPRCGTWWSASQVAGAGAVARSDQSVGVDIEDGRVRPAACAKASAWCATPITSAEQWTQAEAWWKAAGLGTRKPRAGEIPLPATWAEGWQKTTDGGHWLHTCSGTRPWTLAVPVTGPEPPALNIVQVPLRRAPGNTVALVPATTDERYVD